MKKWSVFVLISLTFGSGQVLAQPADQVPDEVVEACMAENNASRLPECLKEGAFGYHMLQLASTSDFYGSNAVPVVESCTSLNATMEGAWTCFRVAAESAAETRALVGLDKIADQCVAAISDPEVLARIQGQAREQRRAWFPNEMISGGNIYHQFRGCMN